MSLTSEEIKNRTVRGVKWNLIEQVGVYSINLVGTVILSRLLMPDQYGLFGMLIVLANFATLVIGMGLGYSVIQNQNLNEKDFSAFFWLNVFLGTAVALLFFLGAPVIATFYHQNELITITRWFCVVFIIQGVGSVPQGILIKTVDFKHFAISQITAAFFSYGVAVAMAFSNFGVGSLVAQSIFFHVISVSCNLHFSKWRPSFFFAFDSIKKIRKFSLNFLSSQIIDFAATNLDAALIGKFFGKRDAGFLGRATALAILPVSSFGLVLNRTWFTMFSSLQKEKQKLQYRYVQAIKILMLTMIPILVLIGFLSEDVVLLLFGSRWTPIAHYVSILSIFAIVSCFNLFQDSFLVSQGRADLLLKMNLIEKSILIVALLSLLRFGISGVIWAKVIVTASMLVPRLLAVNNAIDLKITTWLTHTFKLIIALMVFIVLTWSLRTLFADYFFISRMVSVSILSIAGYYVFLMMFNEQVLRDIQQHIWLQLRQMILKVRNL
ncbi:MAG: lipopolysaccharide biosynthesis protein [Cytophagales bacterium]